MDTQTGDRLSLTIVLAFVSIVVTSTIAFAQANPVHVIAADDVETENETTQTTQYAAQTSGDDAIQFQSNNKKSAPPDVHGTWCGSMNDNVLGSGTISITLNQKGSKLTGSWTASQAGSGTLKGKVRGTAITVTLRQQGTHCRASVKGTLVSPGEITGNYTIFGCQQSDGGTFDITSPDC